VPEHPAVVAGVIDRALLFADLVGTIRRLSEREGLKPRTDALA
jgi:cobyric acid synthase